MNLVATDGTNYDFSQGDQSSVNGTFEATISNNQTATNLMNVINTSSGPSGTRFTATVNGATVTVTQVVKGVDGNTTVTLTDSETAGMTKTDFIDGVPESTPQDNDGDGECNHLDSDDDGDMYSDQTDAFPLDPAEWSDTDGDGTGDNADDDDDNDGWSDSDETDCQTDPYSSFSVPQDLDDDHICDILDSDRDGDGVANDDDYYPDDPSRSTKEIGSIFELMQDLISGEIALQEAKNDHLKLLILLVIVFFFGVVAIISISLKLARGGSILGDVPRDKKMEPFVQLVTGEWGYGDGLPWDGLQLRFESAYKVPFEKSVRKLEEADSIRNEPLVVLECLNSLTRHMRDCMIERNPTTEVLLDNKERSEKVEVKTIINSITKSRKKGKSLKHRWWGTDPDVDLEGLVSAYTICKKATKGDVYSDSEYTKTDAEAAINAMVRLIKDADI